MAYCGVLDCVMTIDGAEADLSRLDEGIIIAGDEEYAAEELITDEVRLEFFNEIHLRSKAELLKDIDDRILKSDSDQRSELLRRFRTEVERKTFPECLEDWEYYDYVVEEDNVKLYLCHSLGFSIYLDDTCDEVRDEQSEILWVQADE